MIAFYRFSADQPREETAMPSNAATNKKRLLLPETMARAGWDFLARRDDVAGVPYMPGLPSREFHALLGDVDAVALSTTPFGAVDLAAGPRLQVVGRLGDRRGVQPSERARRRA